MLILFDFLFFDEPLFLYSDTLQQSLCRLIRWVLRYQLALDCFLQYRLLEGFWEICIECCQFLFSSVVTIEIWQQPIHSIHNTGLFRQWRKRKNDCIQRRLYQVLNRHALAISIESLISFIALQKKLKKMRVYPAVESHTMQSVLVVHLLCGFPNGRAANIATLTN